MASQGGGGPQPPSSAAHLSAGWSPERIFDRERDGTPANESRDPWHLSAALALWPCLLFPSQAGHQWMASSLPGWMEPPSPLGDSLANAQDPPECPQLPFLHLPARLQLLQLQGQGSRGFTKEGRSCAPGPSSWGTFSQPRPPDLASRSLSPGRDSTTPLSLTWHPTLQH